MHFVYVWKKSDAAVVQRTSQSKQLSVLPETIKLKMKPVYTETTGNVRMKTSMVLNIAI